MARGLRGAAHSHARVGHRPQRGRGRDFRAAHRLPGAGAPVLRAGRARHAHHPQPGRARALPARARPAPAPPAGADRPASWPARSRSTWTPSPMARTCSLVVMEQIEEAGVHSGDSACVYPPQTLSATALAQVERYTRALARRLEVRGLMNVQYAVHDGTGLPAGSERPRQPHRALRQQGQRRAARPPRHAPHPRRRAGRPGAPRAGRAGRRLGQGGGPALHQVPRPRPAAAAPR